MKRKLKIGLLVMLGLVLVYVLPIPELTAAKISFNGTYKGEAVGIAGFMPGQHLLFLSLKTFSSNERLRKFYTKSESPAVKCYAFKALMDEKENNALELLQTGIMDEREIITQFGCIIYHEKVGDILYDESSQALTANELDLIDSVLLYSDIDLRCKKHQLAQKEYAEYQYERILQLAQGPAYPEAIVALSKFQRTKDLPLIRHSLANAEDKALALMAVKRFPDSTFYREVVTIQSQAIEREKRLSYPEIHQLYASLLEFENPETIEIFEYLNSLHDTLKPVGYHLDSTEIKHLLGFVKGENMSIYELNVELEAYKYIVDQHWGNMCVVLMEEKKAYFSDFLASLNLTARDIHTLEFNFGLNSSL